MANKNLFQTIAGKLIPRTDVLNHEFAPAYQMTDQASLAQYAATGCLNATFYATEKEQLDTILALGQSVEAEFIAKTAVYAREQGAMKDMPALLCALLTVKDLDRLHQVFDRVIDNGRMLRNFVQIVRSGVVGRKSLGSSPKRLIRNWLEQKSDEAIFRASVGADPSMADIIKMVHPLPKSRQREALYGYMIGKQPSTEDLPGLVRRYEAFKQKETEEIPDVPFQMLTSLPLGQKGWTEIAKNAGWQMTRMNLNTFARHGVFDDSKMVDLVAKRLGNRTLIEKARAFPYQLLVAFTMADRNLPLAIREAIQDAMEIATGNTPRFKGKVVVCPDVSGSMAWASATGYRKGATSMVRCIDVAALTAASLVRRNPDATVLPFEDKVVHVRLNARDSIMTNAEKLAKIGGGGTNMSAPLIFLNKNKVKADLVVFVSDNQSWVDADRGHGTRAMREWNKFRSTNPKARMVCIDIQPYRTTQVKDREDILNIGGFSDQVFTLIKEFAEGRLLNDHWVDVINQIDI